MNIYIYREYVRHMSGISMECVWNIYRIWGYIWNMYGTCMEYAWNMYGICLGDEWNI